MHFGVLSDISGDLIREGLKIFAEHIRQNVPFTQFNTRMRRMNLISEWSSSFELSKVVSDLQVELDFLHLAVPSGLHSPNLLPPRLLSRSPHSQHQMANSLIN
jgi:hypothetical protein